MAIKVTIVPIEIIFIGISSSVRFIFPSAFTPLPLISLAANPTAPLMISHELMMPMIPAIAMPPIPMWRANSEKISSGGRAAIDPAKAGFNVVASASLANGRSGTITNHTSAEPMVMIAAYFNPTMYPNPNTAAPTLSLNTIFARLARIVPAVVTREVKTSAHPPKVETMKS